MIIKKTVKRMMSLMQFWESLPNVKLLRKGATNLSLKEIILI
jgi:hypothetical protein